MDFYSELKEAVDRFTELVDIKRVPTNEERVMLQQAREGLATIAALLNDAERED